MVARVAAFSKYKCRVKKEDLTSNVFFQMKQRRRCPCMPDLNYEELNSEYIECFGKYMQSYLLVATTQLFEHTGLKSNTFKPK